MNNKPAVRRTKKKDDLTVIKGIREARQRVLRQALSVQTYDDLANTSAEDIIAALKAAGQPAARTSVEGWIAEAERLAATRSEQRAKKTGAQVTDSRSAALFFIEFLMPQEVDEDPVYHTKVHYMERDQDEIIDGVDPLLIWSHIGDALRADAPHLAQRLIASVEQHRTAQATESPPPSLKTPVPSLTYEDRLRDVLNEVEQIAGTSIHSGTVQSAAPVVPSPQAEQNSPLAVKTLTTAATHAEPESRLSAADTRLQYYLDRYGMGAGPESAARTEPPIRHAESAMPPSGDVGQIKLTRYLTKYGRV